MGPRLTVFCDLFFDGREIRSGETQIDIEGDRIKSISPSSRCSSSRTDVIDARGRLLAPGLINAHTHTARGGMFSPNEAISINTIVRNFRDLLRAGVTTVGEMGNAAGLTYSLREFFRRNPECGPDIFGCGPLITAPGGYPLDWMPAAVAMLGVAIPCVTAEDGRRAARSVVDAGMDGVKLSIMHKSYGDKPIPAIGKDAARAVVEEAHALGKRVFCHAHYYEDYDLALDVGVDALMHSCFDPLDEAMVENGSRAQVSSTVRPCASSRTRSKGSRNAGTATPATTASYPRGSPETGPSSARSSSRRVTWCRAGSRRGCRWSAGARRSRTPLTISESSAPPECRWYTAPTRPTVSAFSAGRWTSSPLCRGRVSPPSIASGRPLRTRLTCWASRTGA